MNRTIKEATVKRFHYETHDHGRMPVQPAGGGAGGRVSHYAGLPCRGCDCGRWWRDTSTALIGGLMRTSALARGIAGFVSDGALRDVAEWAEGGIRAWARGNSLRGPSKEGSGELNMPVACAGLAVNPGDLILGDGDGVLCIPAAVLPLCKAHAETERRIAANNATGTPDWDRFNALLRQKGCPV